MNNDKSQTNFTLINTEQRSLHPKETDNKFVEPPVFNPEPSHKSEGEEEGNG